MNREEIVASSRQGGSMDGVSVIVPAYNEAGGIAPVIEALRETLAGMGRPWEAIVVDDGSEDQTGRIAEAAGARVLSHPFNMGYGAALKTGIRESRHGIVVITDADGTYPVEKIPDLVEEIEAYDMVVGARIGSKVHIPLVRRPAKWILNQLANFLVGTRIPDLNSGLRVFRKEIVLSYFKLLPSGFSFTTTITLAMHSDAFRVRYHPIDYAKRTGRSKIRPIHDTLNFLQLILRTVIFFNPLKVFLPPSLLLLLAGSVLTTYQAVSVHNITTISVLLISTGMQLLSIGLLADLVVRRADFGAPRRDLLREPKEESS